MVQACKLARFSVGLAIARSQQDLMLMCSAQAFFSLAIRSVVHRDLGILSPQHAICINYSHCSDAAAMICRALNACWS